MFKKTFVSIAFSSQKIEVVELDPSKKKIKIIGSTNLPAGVIVNRQIKNSKSLSQIISSTWKELKITEKSVGIVIPEFSTYTKSFSLPILATPELDEAVRWQSKDFLPGQTTDMVLDWKIISKQNNNCQILVVAIQKDVLTSYVDVIENAGLFPLVVETPSLSLTRITNCGDKGSMVIYVKTDETIIVISQNNSITASSLASSTSQNDIITTAARMLRHYAETPVYSILVGGVGLSQSFLTNISSYLKRPVQTLNLDIAGLSKEQVQEYLIPISLQLKNPTEPADETTINLLPPSWANRYKKQRNYKNFWDLTVASSFVIWLNFLILLSVFVVFNQKQSFLKNKSVSQTSSQESESTETINKINSLSKKVISQEENNIDPISLINEIASKKPSGLRIQKYDFNVEDGEIAIEGQADSRQLLLTFKESLSNLKEIKDVELPITNLINETPINFNMKLITVSQKPTTVSKLKL